MSRDESLGISESIDEPNIFALSYSQLKNKFPKDELEAEIAFIKAERYSYFYNIIREVLLNKIVSLKGKIDNLEVFYIQINFKERKYLCERTT